MQCIKTGDGLSRIYLVLFKYKLEGYLFGSLSSLLRDTRVDARDSPELLHPLPQHHYKVHSRHHH